ncbi:MAG TPA: 2-oxo acid dehydrogenase subunit E2, partial [Pseudonocardiaceae bacterium]
QEAPPPTSTGPAEGAGPGGTHPLDRHQQGVAAVVTRSHREVPTGFTVVRAEVDAVLDVLERLAEETGGMLGLAEVVIAAVAAAHRDFPLFFGRLLDDRTVELAGAPHVGVTVDADGALYVPVVRRAHELSVEDLADTLMDFRMKALGRDFAAHELADGNIAVSLNPDPGVLLVHPIVLWPQVCMVSVGAVGTECRIDPATGAAVPVRCVHLGVAYDHRVVNGRDAALFARRIASALEQPGWVSRPAGAPV